MYQEYWNYSKPRMFEGIWLPGTCSLAWPRWHSEEGLLGYGLVCDAAVAGARVKQSRLRYVHVEGDKADHYHDNEEHGLENNCPSGLEARAVDLPRRRGGSRGGGGSRPGGWCRARGHCRSAGVCVCERWGVEVPVRVVSINNAGRACTSCLTSHAFPLIQLYLEDQACLAQH